MRILTTADRARLAVLITDWWYTWGSSVYVVTYRPKTQRFNVKRTDALVGAEFPVLNLQALQDWVPSAAQQAAQLVALLHGRTGVLHQIDQRVYDYYDAQTPTVLHAIPQRTFQQYLSDVKKQLTRPV